MNKKSMIVTIVFFGALWGIIEATLGYVLQFLPPYVSGAVMFPIAATILLVCYHNTGSAKSLILVGLIAASFKSVNFLMPGLLAVKTYNPMIAIVLQSCMVAVCANILNKVSIPEKIGIALAMSVGWRLLFVLNVTINHAFTGFPFPQISSQRATLSFILIDGIIAGLVLGLMVYGLSALVKDKVRMFIPKPALTFVMVVLAVVVTVVL